jgi:hypothetical protein
MTNRLLISCVAACVGFAVFAALAAASCMPTTAAQQRASATLIFDGVALEGPTGTGIQRFKVLRYLKGRGPLVVRVNTGYVHRADGTGSVTSVSLVVRRGEHWRIFGRGSAQKVIQTNVCNGSKKL